MFGWKQKVPSLFVSTNSVDLEMQPLLVHSCQADYQTHSVAAVNLSDFV